VQAHGINIGKNKSQCNAQPPVEPPAPDSTDLKASANLGITSLHLVEVKYCEDTRPQNQLNAAKEQHKDSCTFSKEPL
jgi:hypothetical protein